jgi:UDP-N-acetylglucosamine acyltransferase
VHVGDRAFLGGGAVIHQFCRIGEGAMVGGGARISLDIAPFYLVTERNAVIGLNVVGLRRRGLKRDVVDELKRAFQVLNAPVGNLKTLAAAALARQEFSSVEAQCLLQFFQSGRRGFARARRGSGSDMGGDDAADRP